MNDPIFFFPFFELKEQRRKKKEISDTKYLHCCFNEEEEEEEAPAPARARSINKSSDIVSGVITRHSQCRCTRLERFSDERGSAPALISSSAVPQRDGWS